MPVFYEMRLHRTRWWSPALRKMVHIYHHRKTSSACPREKFGLDSQVSQQGFSQRKHCDHWRKRGKRSASYQAQQFLALYWKWQLWIACRHSAHPILRVGWERGAQFLPSPLRAAGQSLAPLVIDLVVAGRFSTTPRGQSCKMPQNTNL